MRSRVHRAKGLKVIKSYRIFPYGEIVEILKEDGTAFFEDSQEQPLKRGTVWRAARRLSDLMGRKVLVERVLVKLPSGEELLGYLFGVEAQKVVGQNSKHV
jgi:hypothetical protein